jgi:hypothetical protein
VQKRLSRRTQVQFAYHLLKHTFGFGDDGTENKPSGWLAERLGDNFSVINNLRADLTALFLASDTAVIESGLVPDDITRQVFFDEYILSVVQLIASGIDVERCAEWRSMLIVLNYMTEHKSVDVVYKKNAGLFVAVVNYRTFKDSVRELLASVRKIKFLGDKMGAQHLVEQYGSIPAGWRNALKKRFNALKISGEYAAVYPVMTPLRKKDGEITDITLGP